MHKPPGMWLACWTLTLLLSMAAAEQTQELSPTQTQQATLEPEDCYTYYLPSNETLLYLVSLTDYDGPSYCSLASNVRVAPLTNYPAGEFCSQDVAFDLDAPTDTLGSSARYQAITCEEEDKAHITFYSNCSSSISVHITVTPQPLDILSTMQCSFLGYDTADEEIQAVAKGLRTLMIIPLLLLLVIIGVIVGIVVCCCYSCNRRTAKTQTLLVTTEMSHGPQPLPQIMI